MQMGRTPYGPEDSHLLVKERDLKQTLPSQPSEGPNPGNALISHFQFLQTVRQFLLFKPLSLWYFIIATPANQYTTHTKKKIDEFLQYFIYLSELCYSSILQNNSMSQRSFCLLFSKIKITSKLSKVLYMFYKSKTKMQLL